MPRNKKMVKSTPAKKNQKTQNLAQLEKSFKSMPAQLAAHCRKELSVLKQQEKKLAAASKQAESLLNNIQKKSDALSQANPTASNKKQLVSVKKGHAKAMQACKAIAKEWEWIQKAVQGLAEKNDKFVALSKEWNWIENQVLEKWQKAHPKKAAVKPSRQKGQKDRAVVVKAEMMEMNNSQHDSENQNVETA